jgi:hypothetical protein
MRANKGRSDAECGREREGNLLALLPAMIGVFGLDGLGDGWNRLFRPVLCAPCTLWRLQHVFLRDRFYVGNATQKLKHKCQSTFPGRRLTQVRVHKYTFL